MSKGQPGMGKSQMLFLLNKPKWMPLWLHKWREKRAWLRWNRDRPLIIAIPELDPSDLSVPNLNQHYIAKPRKWGE